jgi:hypothetical protein
MNQEYSTKWWAAFTCIAFLEAILVVMLLSGQHSIQLVFALVIIATLLFLFPRLDDVVSMTFDRGVFENKLNGINKKIGTSKSRIDKLVLLSMSKSAYDTLKKISSGTFGAYKMSENVERDIYFLLDLGYINSVEKIRNIPYEGSNLSEYLKITDVGKQFIDLRKSVEEDSK